MRKIIPVICLNLILFLAAGCGNRYNERQPLVHSLKMGYLPDMAFLPYFVANEADIYDSLGLDMDPVQYSSTSELYAAFESGKTDVVIAGITDALLLAEKGVPFRIIARGGSHYYLLSNPMGTVTSPGELTGKNIAYTRQQLQDYALDYILRENNIDSEELNRPVIEKDFIRQEMLENNLIDATILTGKEAKEAADNGSQILVKLTEKEFPAQVVLVRSDSLLIKEREVKALLKGYNIAIRLMDQEPGSITLTREMIDEAGIAGDNLEHYLLPDYTAATPPGKEQLMEVIGWMKEKEYLPAGFNDKEFTDTIIKKY